MEAAELETIADLKQEMNNNRDNCKLQEIIYNQILQGDITPIDYIKKYFK